MKIAKYTSVPLEVQTRMAKCPQCGKEVVPKKLGRCRARLTKKGEGGS